METRTDSPSVGRYDEEHLRRFVLARKHGDATEMRKWWDELVIDFFDRMDGFVGAAHKGRLNDDEHDLAVQMAMIRFSKNLIDTFRGASVGELVNACKTLARGICIDVQDGAARRRRNEGVSLDAGWDRSDDDDAPAPAWERDEAQRRLDAEERSRDVIEFLEWALPRVNEKYRTVLEMTFEGHEVPEICKALDIQPDNAFQRRSRGMKALKQLKEQYES